MTGRPVQSIWFSLVVMISSVAAGGAFPASLPTGSPPSTISKEWELADAFLDGTFTGNLRAYYINRKFDKIGGEPEHRIQESLAVGGSLGYETAPWHGLGLGGVVYLSQGVLLNNPNFGGGGVLGPDNESYAVLGQAYLQYNAAATTVRLYRQSINTPFINSDDYKMTPKTWEAYTLYNRDLPDTTLMVSNIQKIKGWTATGFQYMGEYINNNGTYHVDKSNIPVTLAGGVWEPADNYKFQLWDYFAYEYFNGFYFQGDASWLLTGDGLTLGVALQGWEQRSVGEEVGGEFNTCFGGGMLDLSWKGLALSSTYTIVDRSHRVVNPWATSFSFNSMIEEDFDHAGEEAFSVGFEYDFSELGIGGLTASVYLCNGDTPATGPGASPSQKEYDAFIKYTPGDKLEGLHLVLKGAIVDSQQSFPEGEDYHDIRFIVNYDFGFGIRLER